MIDAVIAWSIRRRGLVVAAAALIAIAGAASLFRIPVDVIPDLSENQVIVFADWPGHAPQEVEDQVTSVLTSKLSGLSQLGSVRGTSEFNFAMVSLIFEEGAQLRDARTRVVERLAAAGAGLPAGVTLVLAPDANELGQIYWYTLEGGGQDLGELRALQDSYVRPQLAAVPGVAEVASVGGSVREYQIAVDPERLRSLGIPLGEVVAAVGRASGAVGGEAVARGSAEFAVRGLTWAKSAEDLGAIVVATRGKAPVLLRQLARVQLGPAPRRSILEKDGAEAVGGVVLMQQGENPLAVTARIRARVDALQAGLPAGVRIAAFYQRARLVGAALATLRRTLLEEVAVCVVMVLLVLGHARSALVVVLTLPVAVLASFACMWLFGVSSNIMSLAGIAIAIGVLADSAIVMTENAHARLHASAEGGVVRGDQREVALRACLRVGRPLFFSVLITMVSFLPVFALGGMEGKLFRPLALTKLFALATAAVLAVTLVPALIPTFVRGRLRGEEQNPLVRSVAAVYRPMLSFLLDRPGWVLTSLCAVLAVGALLFPRLGSEFMPALDEGAILEMPVTAPGIALEEAGRDLGVRDAILRSLPEVESVVGKVGRAETATDPAPVEMIETAIALKPPDEWPARALPRGTFLAAAVRALPGDVAKEELLRIADAAQIRFDARLRPLARSPGAKLEEIADAALVEAISAAARERGLAMEPGRPLPRPFLARKTKGELTRELDAMLQMPGWTNVWTQPIAARVDMLATGIRTQVGVKVLGQDLQSVQSVADAVAAVLRDVPGAADVAADQLVGQPQLEVRLDREAAAREGISAGALEEAIEVAVAGKVAGVTLEGRRRIPLRVRYARDFRQDPDALGRVLVGEHPPVPLARVATVRIAEGASMIRSENGQLASYVQLNVRDRDLGSFVADAQVAVAARVQLPPGTALEWGGQYAHELSARRTLTFVLPAVLALIFLILYWTWSDAADALLLMLAVPGALVGGLVFQWLCGFPFSVAVWVGYIACFGLATETGIIMLVYLREAVERRGGLAAIGSAAELRTAVLEGAVQRLRPKLLTEGVIVLSLLPMLWASGAGAEILRPMSAPVLGGILVADEVIDLSIPVLFYWLRKARLPCLRAPQPGPSWRERALGSACSAQH